MSKCKKFWINNDYKYTVLSSYAENIQYYNCIYHYRDIRSARLKISFNTDFQITDKAIVLIAQIHDLRIFLAPHQRRQKRL